MAIQRPSINVPTPIEPIRFARNGRAPLAAIAGKVLGGLNHVVGFRRKTFFAKSLHLDTLPASSATTLTPWRTYIRTGYAASGSLRLVFHTIGAPADSSAANPRVLWNISGGITSPEPLRVPVNTGTITPSDLVSQVASVTVSANTAYEIDCQLINYGRIVSACIYEDHDGEFEDGDTGVSSRQLIQERGVITDAQANQMLYNGHNLWKANAAPVLAWCTDTDPDNGGTAPVRSTASYRNIFDQSISAVSDASPGFQVATQYHNPEHSANVPCVLAVYATNASAPGGDVRLRDSSGTLATVSSFGTSGEWKTATCNLSGSAFRQKVDLQLQGDGSNNLTVHAVALYEYTS